MKKILLLIPLFLFAMAPVIANEAETATATEEVEEAVVVEEVAEEESTDLEPVSIIGAAITEPALAARSATASSAAKRKTAAAARVSMVPAGIRSAAAPAPIIVKAAEPKVEVVLDCSVGEFQKGNKCVACDQKNNPGVRWKNSGKDCEIECISNEYVLVDEEKVQPKCLQKCDVWGGTATREWVRDNGNFSFCGSGKFLECRKGFARTWEQTSSSGVEHGHCALEGTMTGKCKTNGQMKPGNLANGKCMQVCENGFWSGCTIQRFCDKGFREDLKKEVIVIKDKKETKAVGFECVK